MREGDEKLSCAAADLWALSMAIVVATAGVGFSSISVGLATSCRTFWISVGLGTGIGVFRWQLTLPPLKSGYSIVIVVSLLQMSGHFLMATGLATIQVLALLDGRWPCYLRFSMAVGFACKMSRFLMAGSVILCFVSIFSTHPTLATHDMMITPFPPNPPPPPAPSGAKCV